MESKLKAQSRTSKCKDQKCKNQNVIFFCIDSLNELGNFKQKHLHFENKAAKVWTFQLFQNSERSKTRLPFVRALAITNCMHYKRRDVLTVFIM